jgi:hypothetical protein
MWMGGKTSPLAHEDKSIRGRPFLVTAQNQGNLFSFSFYKEAVDSWLKLSSGHWIQTAEVRPPVTNKRPRSCSNTAACPVLAHCHSQEEMDTSQPYHIPNHQAGFHGPNLHEKCYISVWFSFVSLCIKDIDVFMQACFPIAFVSLMYIINNLLINKFRLVGCINKSYYCFLSIPCQKMEYGKRNCSE